MPYTVDDMFDMVARLGASDVIFVPGARPVVWVAGIMQTSDLPLLDARDIEAVFLPLLNEDQSTHLRKMGDLDFSLGRHGVGRFRINLHQQRGSLSAAMRFIPTEVPSFDRLKLPQRLLQFADLPRGLVLVTGGAGTGKSTTLAALIDYMNRGYAYHIITLEDPIEFTFRHSKSIIEQREIGVDCATFASALRHVVRQRPDVILVGEMRDLETIGAALTAAETGHLVMASLHTVSAVETVNRIVDVFPAAQQGQIRVQLADTLQGVACQTLFHDEKDGGMVPAVEILFPTPAIRRAIRDGETHLLAGMVETGKAIGMQTMDSAIAALVAGGRITSASALAKAHNPERLAKAIA
jgi:twitching motility protein PilT